MATFNQLIRGTRRKVINKKKRILHPPQIRGVCVNVTTMNPKKPNSAMRKICKVRLFKTVFRKRSESGLTLKRFTGSTLIAKIPGEKHNLKEYSVVLISRRNSKDLPGVGYQVVRGKLDSEGVKGRQRGRSLYGTKKG